MLTTGQAPWMMARYEMDLMLTHLTVLRRGWDLLGGHIERVEQPGAAAAHGHAEATGFRADPAQMSLVGWLAGRRFRQLDQLAVDCLAPT